jgi:hypothetical protein
MSYTREDMRKALEYDLCGDPDVMMILRTSGIPRVRYSANYAFYLLNIMQ